MAIFVFQPQAIINIMPIVWVTCYESSSRPDPHLALPRHIRLGVIPKQGRDSWKWFAALWIVCFQSTLQNWMRDTCRLAFGCNACAPHGDKTLTVNDITVKTCAAAHPLSSRSDSVTGWSEPSRYPSNVSLSEIIGLLCVLSTLTCWGFISWPVVFLSLQLGFWHNLRSRFPILLRWRGAFPFFMTK